MCWCCIWWILGGIEWMCWGCIWWMLGCIEWMCWCWIWWMLGCTEWMCWCCIWWVLGCIEWMCWGCIWWMWGCTDWMCFKIITKKAILSKVVWKRNDHITKHTQFGKVMSFSYLFQEDDLSIGFNSIFYNTHSFKIAFNIWKQTHTFQYVCLYFVYSTHSFLIVFKISYTTVQ